MYNTDPSEVPDEVDSSVPDGSQLERDSGDARPAGGAATEPEPVTVTVDDSTTTSSSTPESS